MVEKPVVSARAQGKAYRISRPRVVGVIMVSFFVFVKDAVAYIDPGSTSILLQILFAGVAGVLISGRKLIVKLWRLLRFHEEIDRNGSRRE